MPRPVALGNGVYHLNIRVPSDLADKARGTTVTLPVEGRATTVRIGDKVIVSLRTKDPAVAKVRFAEAEQALTHFWSAIRSGPVTLLHKQVVALAGEVYRRWVDLYKTSPDMTSEGFAADMRRMDADVEAWRFDPSVGTSAISPSHGWRHTWITCAEAAGIGKRFSNRITGHNNVKDVSDGYVAPIISKLAAEMAKFPVYSIE